MSVKPLRQLLTLQSLFAILLPFGVVSVVGFIWIPAQIIKNAEADHLQIARAVGIQVESHLEKAATIVRAAANMPRASRVPGHGYQEHFDSLLMATDTMSSMYGIRPDGSVSVVSLQKGAQAHRDDILSLNLSRNPLLRDTLQSNKPRWSETFLSVINGGLAAAYAVPGDGETVIGEVDLGLLTKFLKQISPENENLVLIVDHKGQIVADNNGNYTAQQVNIGNIPLVHDGIASDAPSTGRFEFEGHAMVGSIIQIHEVDWHVLVAKTDASLYNTTWDIAFFVIAGFLSALICSLITSIYMARNLSSRFNDLNCHAQNIAEGVITGEWPVSAIDEFNQLSGNLQKMSRKLQDSEVIHRTLFEQLPDGVILWDISTLKPIQFNTAAHTLLGYTRDEFSALTVSDFEESLGNAEISVTMEKLHQNGTVSFETVHRTKTGDSRNMLITLRMIELGEKTMILAIHHDLTEHKRVEEESRQIEQQLLHAQKLESLGVLAGGIAHDFNNILMAIIGNADLALMRINKESPAIENLQRIEQAAARAADLAKQMLAYSGKGKFVVENINLNILLEEMLHMLEVSISKKAVLTLNPYQPLPSVKADATQIRQIVMNLVINASEAIGEKSGVIVITTGCMECYQSYLKEVWLNECISEGTYVYLEITDTGCGMDKETVAKLFDPFFTTKFTGRGLGMAAVLGIVRGHKGAIKVYSEPGKGTTFTVLLPASDRPSEIFNNISDNEDWHGSGTVLLVDDEETVRGIGKEMLKELGFTTITASDGKEAVEIFKCTSDIAFVILDLTMPHMDGEQCFRELKKLKPGVKVIMSSGYNEQEVTQKFAGKGLAGFVQKPYKISVLKEAISLLSKQEPE